MSSFITKQGAYTKSIIIASIAVPIVVAILMLAFPSGIENAVDLSFLPGFHAIINGITAVLLVLAFYFIKQGKIEAHKKTVLLAVFCAALFLVSYVLSHTFNGSTPYPVNAPYRTLYLSILFSHIVLSAVIIPFVLFTLLRGLTGKYEKHKKIARFALPMWLYVSITGVIVYLFMQPYY